MVNTRSLLSGESVVKETFPPVVVISPLLFIAPVFVRVIFPAEVCVKADKVNVLLVLTRIILPPPLFVAVKVERVFAPFNVSPPTEVADSEVLLMAPAPLSEIIPLESKLMVPGLFTLLEKTMLAPAEVVVSVVPDTKDNTP